MKFMKAIFLSLAMIAQVHFAYAVDQSIIPNGKATFLDQNGKPLTNGKVFFYSPSSTTPKTTYQDLAGTIPNSQPIVLDAAGRALIWGSGNYRQQVLDRNNNVIWDVTTSAAGSGSSGPIATGDGDAVGTLKPWPGAVAPNQYMFTYGQELSRTTFAPLFQAITSAQPAFCTSGNPTLTGLSNTDSFWIGMPVEISCIVAGFSTVISKTATSVTLAANANLTTGATATFFMWGRGNGVTTFNLPDLRGFVIAGNNIMGGVSGSQLTTTYFGTQNPNSAGAAGGQQNRTLTLSNLVPYTPAGTNSTSSSGTGDIARNNAGISSSNAGGGANGQFTGGAAFVGNVTVGAQTFTGTAQGGGLGSAASAVVAAGGAGYSAGTQLLTVSGGTCTTQPTFNITGVAGAITAPVLVDAGLCSVAPANPAATTGGGGAGGTLTVTYTQAPFSTVQPTKTSNYIIKVTPDTTLSGTGVTSLGGMTGDIVCGSNLTCAGATISAIFNIPSPTAISLGGVFSKTCSASNWFNALDTTGTFTCLQPNFTDMAGTIQIAQISANLITNAKLAVMPAFTFKGNNTNGSAGPTDVDIAALTSKASPAAGDFIMLSDQAASGAWKKATVSSIASAGSVSSIAGNTGAFTLSHGITNSVNDIQLSLTNATLQAAPGNPAATTSTTGVMTGVGGTCKLTPVYSTRILVSFNFDQQTSGTGTQAYQLKFGTGVAPANNAATTGTTIGTLHTSGLAIAGAPLPSTGSGIITGLSAGTAYWFDLDVRSSTGTTTITGIDCNAMEF